jgi:nicotinate-nucleotide adenylyltransferase
VRVAVFGGSFNPPHLGHVLACSLVLATEDLDRVLVVPAYQHPFAKALAPFDDRVAMCELAMGSLRGVEVSRVEEELGGESRTLRTLEHLSQQHPDWQWHLIIGADVLA